MTEKQDQVPATEESALEDGAEASEEDIWSEFDNEEAAADGGREPSAAKAADDEGRQEAADLEASDDNPPAGDEPAGNETDAPEPDLWAGASEKQRAAWQAAQAQIAKLEQAERSNRGRLSALQRQINESMAKPPAAAPAAAGKGEAKTDSQSADGFTESEEWKSFSEEYPEVAGPLAKFIGSLESRVTHQQKELAAIGDDRRKSALDEQASLLEADHPDWREATAGDPGFVDWVHSQPRHIQEAAYRNANEIVDAAEAADVVGRFKAFRSASKNSPNSGKTNERLAGKRQRQLESAAATRTRGPGVVSGIAEDGDPETIWRQLDEQEAREARRA